MFRCEECNRVSEKCETQFKKYNYGEDMNILGERKVCGRCLGFAPFIPTIEEGHKCTGGNKVINVLVNSNNVHCKYCGNVLTFHHIHKSIIKLIKKRAEKNGRKNFR